MLVKDIIQAIENKEMKVQDVAAQYNVSERTIQNKVKALGFKWNPKEGKYDDENISDDAQTLDFDELMKSVRRNVTNDVEAVTKQSGSVKKEPKTERKNVENDDFDKLDYLLFNSKVVKNKRNYRGFYFDEDILAVIDSVSSGNKSELVNEALRKVFKDKGLLGE